MTIEPAVLSGIMMSTWSLREAAYYVHNLDSTVPGVLISPKSRSRPSKTYFWLKKELDRGRIRPVVVDDEGKQRFSPGTIMRHLDEMGQGFHKPVLKAYLKHGVLTGPTDANKDAKFTYQRAAVAIRERHPKVRKAQVAELLTQLPQHMGDIGDKSLPGFSAVTIRKHLNISEWPGKPGRPPKGEDQLPKIDWSAIVKKLI